MNDFVAKKLGEVHAFVQLVAETYQRGSVGFAQAVPADRLAQTTVQLARLIHTIEQLASQDDKLDVTQTKSGATLAKISRARDEYIAERWDDTVELYEWFSFNAGAGAAHAHEVVGAAQALGHTELLALCTETEAFFDELLQTAKEYLYEEGSRQAA